MSWIFGVLKTVHLLITFFFTKERESVSVKNDNAEPMKISDSFKDLVKNKYFS
ncbi:MAG: hypothetical protein PQJ50_11555 [Spirochaetales bacterium]|nr:hypothetical protein [Spirochaetales bacterium]